MSHQRRLSLLLTSPCFCSLTVTLADVTHHQPTTSRWPLRPSEHLELSSERTDFGAQNHSQPRCIFIARQIWTVFYHHTSLSSSYPRSHHALVFIQDPPRSDFLWLTIDFNPSRKVSQTFFSPSREEDAQTSLTLTLTSAQRR